MKKLNDIFNSFSEGLNSSNYPSLTSFTKNKLLTKGLTLMMAGSVLAGCQSTPEDYMEAESNLSNISTEVIETITEKEMNQILNGESGVFKSNDNQILIISNIDDNSSMSPVEKNQLDLLITDELRNTMKDESAYMSPEHKYAPVGYLHVYKDQIRIHFDELGLYVPTLNELGDKFTIAHELSHFYTVAHVTDTSNNFSELTLSETSADVGGLMFLVKSENLDLETFNKLADDLMTYRVATVRDFGSTGYHTAYGVKALKEIVNKDPNVLNQIKDSSINSIMNVSLDISHGVQKDGEAEWERTQDYFEVVTEEVAHYIKNGMFPDESVIDALIHSDSKEFVMHFQYQAMSKVSEQCKASIDTLDSCNVNDQEIIAGVTNDIYKTTRNMQSMDSFTESIDFNKVSDLAARVSDTLGKDAPITDYTYIDDDYNY